jgi:rare lipoprotein A
MELRHTTATSVRNWCVYFGMMAILGALGAPVACNASSKAEFTAGTLADTAAFDTRNPKVQRHARELAREHALRPPNGRHVVEDHSGRKQLGKASVYAPSFQGRKMANGQIFDQKSRAAASKSLPLGTVAKVTNLQNGRTALVTVEDHGPYVNGRVVDVTAATARQLGISKSEGIAPVVVAPVAVPQSNGAVMVGAGAVPGPATAN